MRRFAITSSRIAGPVARRAAAAALLLACTAHAAPAENNPLNTLLRVASAIASARVGFQEDFEAPAVPNSTTYRAGQVLTTRSNAWQVESGTIDLVNARVRTEVATFDGSQLIDLAGSPGPGVVSTRVSTRVGQAYTVTLRYGRNNGLGKTAARATVDVLGGSGAQRLHAELAHDPARLAFNALQTWTGTFVADAARTQVRLTSLNGGNAGMTVDGITIMPATAAEIAAMQAGGSTTPAAASSTTTATAAAAGATARAEDRAAFMTRCKREVVAAYAGAARQADSICGSKWDMVTASNGMVDALLAAAPAAGARFDAAAVRRDLTSVRWRAKADAGQAASGQLRDIAVGLTSTPMPGMSLSWFKNGEPIPFELEEALRVRGASVTMIGCFAMGAAEGGRIWRVAMPGKAPFALTIAFREAAVASQSSDYNASADFSGRLPTLASLRRDGNDWQASCPQ